MKQDLTLNVGTKYDGDGMKKLDTALKNSARTVGAAGRAIGSVSSELQQLGGKAGQAAGAVSGLFSALMTSGPLAAVVAGIGVAVGAIVKAFQDAKEKAKDAAEALADSFNKAVEKTVQRIQKIKDALNFKKRESSIEQQFGVAQAGIAQRESQLFIRRRYAQQRENASSEFERAQIDAAEKRDLAIDEAKFKRSSAFDSMGNTNKEVLQLRESYEKLIAEVNEQRDVLFKERRQLEQSPVAQKYKQLSTAVDRAAKVVADKGENAIVGIKEVWTANAVGATGAVSYSKTQVNVTAKKELEDAKAALKKFEEENSEVIKQAESYKNNLKALEKSESDLAAAQLALKEVDNKLIISARNLELSGKEYEVAVKAAEQQYKDDIKNAEKIQKQKDEQAKKQKEAEQKQLDAAKKQAEQELEAAKKQAAQEEKQARRQQLQDELDKLTEQQRKTAMQQLNEHRAEAAAAKELAEAEKKAKSILDDWADNKKQDAGAWGREQDAAAKARMEQNQQEAKNLQKAKNTANELGKQLFGANGLRAGANTDQLAKFAQMSDYLGAGNVTQTQRDALQGAADKLRAKVFDSNGNLKVSRASKDLKNLQRIEQLLGKMDAQDKAKQLQAQQKQREEQRARIAEQQFQAVKDIRDKMKNLGV